MNTSQWKFALLALATLSLAACSSTSPDAVATAPVDMTLRKGMTIPEVEALFGYPTSLDEKIMGQKTGTPWEGVIMKYKMDEDPAYRYAVHYLTNTLVFTKATNPPTLVYWEIQQAFDAKYLKAHARQASRED